MEEANLTKSLEAEFEKIKSNIDKKINDFKNRSKNNMIRCNFDAVLKKINLSRQKSLNNVNGIYDSLEKCVTNELDEFNSFLLAPIEQFRLKIEELSEDTYHHPSKKLKRDSSDESAQKDDDYETILKRRIDIINEIKETIDLQAIFDKKLNENWSHLDFIDSKFKKFEEKLNYQIALKQNNEDKNLEIKFLSEISDEKLLSSTSNELIVWNRKTCQSVNRINTFSHEITSVLPLDTEGVLIAVGFIDGIIKILNNQTKHEIQNIQAHDIKITSLVALNELEFVSGSLHGELKIWKKIEDFNSVWRSKKLKGSITCILSYNLNGQPLIVCGLNSGTIVNIVARKPISYYGNFKHTEAILCLEKLESKNYLFAGSSDNLINLWCMESKQLIHTISHHNTEIKCLKIVDDSRLLSLTDNRLILSNLHELEIIKEAYLYQDGVTCSIITNKFTIVNGTFNKNVNFFFPNIRI
ncbi:unnamed protein product [Brachionus calyciflorus]|uniref:Uncharacterized protein n=1 Tax=Brachionus calyciflorus TaxID=104777 RepID=A0A814A536_9BILA|nr:unnamed protein product [Brachionus calyciflorus]